MTGDAQVAQVEVFHNEYLPEGGTVVDAVVTVTMGEGSARAAAGTRASAAEIIMIDCSGSMEGNNIRAARNAAGVAIDTIRDGVQFAIIGGSHHAWPVYPGNGDAPLAVASERTRQEAKAAVRGLRTSGGTSFSTWLDLTLSRFAASTAELKHAILLTDGENTEAAQEFQSALDRCVGRFSCDSRGVGRGWLARDLLLIAEQLHGSADGIKDPSDLADDFRQMMQTAMGKSMADVALRLWTPAGSRVRFVKQVFPDIVDLTDRRTDVSARVGEYPVGAWGAETRDYHVSVEVTPEPVGQEILAARLSVVHRDDVLAQGRLRVVWTDDLAYSTRVIPQVAQVDGQAELAAVIQEGLAARTAGDLEKATAQLGRAVRLAHEAGNVDKANLLARVVDVIDAPSGTVRLRRRTEHADVDVDAEIASVESRKTSQVRRS
jgi:hypothetical protein